MKDNRHIKLMSHQCSPCHFDFDYVLHLETFAEDMKFVLKKIGADDISPMIQENFKSKKFTKIHYSPPKKVHLGKKFYLSSLGEKMLASDKAKLQVLEMFYPELLPKTSFYLNLLTEKYKYHFLSNKVYITQFHFDIILYIAERGKILEDEKQNLYYFYFGNLNTEIILQWIDFICEDLVLFDYSIPGFMMKVLREGIFMYQIINPSKTANAMNQMFNPLFFKRDAMHPII